MNASGFAGGIFRCRKPGKLACQSGRNEKTHEVRYKGQSSNLKPDGEALNFFLKDLEKCAMSLKPTCWQI